METLDEILFYSLDKSVKAYRQFAQRQLDQHGFDLTIDQWLILKAIQEHPDWKQQQLAQAVFKDVASVTRMVELLVQKDFLTRLAHSADRRRFHLSLTEAAHQVLRVMQPTIVQNRQRALLGLDDQQCHQLRHALQLIISNCQA